MSKILAPIPTVLAALVLILQFFTFAEGQDVDVRIRIKAEKTVTAEVSVTINAASTAERIWFMDQYGEVSGLLTKRLSHIYFYDKAGYLIARKSLIPNELVSLTNIGKLAYTVDLTPRQGSFAAAHTSWAKGDEGVLFLDDLLPQGVLKTAKVKVDIPLGWRIQHSELEQIPGIYTLSNVDKSVFYIGRSIREQQIRPANYGLAVSITGEWLFTDAEAAEMVRSVFLEYERSFGRLQNSVSRVRITKFPSAVGMGNWEADTRGRSVTIVSSDMPFKSQSLQRLHEQLRHELLHLWLPNGVYLTGNYDWFYEGFILYQSLKTGVGVNRLRFEDYLDTLSRAYNIDSVRSKKLSLTDASTDRWSGSNTQVYARGMLVAFLCDLALLENSNGKTSVTKLLREVYDRHKPPGNATDGNAAVIKILKEHPELIPIVERYIVGAEPIDWAAMINGAGLRVEVKDQLTTLQPVDRPSGKQKKILEKLGIDNWKKN